MTWEPVMRDSPPPPGIRRARAGLNCGNHHHARELLVCHGIAELRARVRRWKCPQCGRPAFGEDR